MKKNIWLIIFCLFGVSFLPLACGKAPQTISKTTVATVDPLGYFPSQVGNLWVYQIKRTIADKSEDMLMELKITGFEEVNGVTTFVLESFLQSKPLQKEYYGKTDKALFCQRRVIVRDDGDIILDLNPAEKMLEFPLQAGQKWTWSGKADVLAGDFVFTVVGEEKITVSAGTFDTYKLKIDGKMADGSTAVSFRWFARDVGMVKEETTVTSGAKMTVLAELKSYTVKR